MMKEITFLISAGGNGGRRDRSARVQ